MLTRRNVRINVFQTIFENNHLLETDSAKSAKKHFNQKIEQSKALFAACFHLSSLVCDYAILYAQQRASKHLPTAEDLNVSSKLAGNIVLQQLKKNESFAQVVKANHIHLLFDNEFVREIFLKLIATQTYQTYISSEERNSQDEKRIMEFITQHLIFEDEHMASHFAGLYMNWFNEFELLYLWIPRVYTNAQRHNFNEVLSTDKLAFGEDLLTCYYEKKSLIADIIKPKLINWDADRVALIDLILIHLGVCEFLYFQSIPVKVTINEYIDLAKSYSTPQSGQFVNGILDNIRKELEAGNKIHKVDYVK